VANPLILIIDDDAKLNALLERFLPDFGFRVLSAVEPAAGLKALARHRPDLVILDVMLPGRSGFDVCREIRRTDNVPIVMLTARGDVADRIVGLELGADDYLPKPFEPRELVARIQSVLRRPRADVQPVRCFGDLEIDLARREARLRGRPLDLTTNEFEVLRLLSGRPGHVLDRDTILETLRGLEHEAFNRAVDVTVSRLRQKLGDDPRAPRFIRTVWATGYVFIARGDGEDAGDNPH
jgi:DNA-binding response OmpR family regulator